MIDGRPSRPARVSQPVEQGNPPGVEATPFRRYRVIAHASAKLRCRGTQTSHAVARSQARIRLRPRRRHEDDSAGVTGARQRIWIDLANTPHVLVFTPIVERLRREGWEVVLTARDHAQTLDLAREQWPEVVAIGGASPAGRWPKLRTLGGRARALYRFARHSRPAVALSHGSYAQLVAASAAGIATVTMMDYEHQPANHLAFRLARRSRQRPRGPVS